MRVAYFTGGTHGAGHLVRALAIARGLSRLGADAELVVLSPRGPFTRLVPQAIEIEADPRALADEARAPRSALARTLGAMDVDLLLVDLFWAPLRFLLPSLDVPAWLLLRQAPPAWLRGPPGVPFEPALFERVIGIEPGLPFAVREEIPPIVIANPDELLPPATARTDLGASSERPLALVVHAGLDGEAPVLTREAEARFGDTHEVITSDLFDPSAPFPAATRFSAADVIVGAAGYNLFWETRWLGVSKRSRLRPVPRTIDLPAARVAAGRSYDMAANGADVLAGMVGSERA